MGTQSTWGSTIHTFAPISATLNRSASTFYTKQIPNTQPSQWHSQQATSARSFLPSSSHLLVSSLRQVLRPYRTKLLYTNKQTARLRCRSPHQHPVDDSWLYPWHHSRSLHHPQVLECARWLPSPGRSTPQPGTPKTPSDEPPPDTVRLWDEGYADRYYEQKFGVGPRDIEFRNKVARAYVEGLAWVLLYYFQGCPSWDWYYPYHYAPFAADFSNIADMKISFEKGRIFRPFEQLM